MARMQAAEAMVRILEDEGVEVIFGIPGSGASARVEGCSWSGKELSGRGGKFTAKKLRKILIQERKFM